MLGRSLIAALLFAAMAVAQDAATEDAGTDASTDAVQAPAVDAATELDKLQAQMDQMQERLDAATEAKVQAALDEVMKERTTFVIAHRLSTVRNATRILVFDDSRVVESGTFDELVRRGGYFAALAKAQFLIVDAAPQSAQAEPQMARG